MKTKPNLIRFQPNKSVGRRRDTAAARASSMPEPERTAGPAAVDALGTSGREGPAIQTSFRHMAASAAVTARIEAEVEKLRRFFDGITHCHVVVIAPHRHHRAGRRYSLHIELGVPRERLVIAHEPAMRPGRDDVPRTAKSAEVDAPHKDVYVAVRDAFATARRQLKDYVHRLRGDVKRHLPAAGTRRAGLAMPS